jgi:hypothetical protein
MRVLHVPVAQPITDHSNVFAHIGNVRTTLCSWLCMCTFSVMGSQALLLATASLKPNGLVAAGGRLTVPAGAGEPGGGEAGGERIGSGRPPPSRAGGPRGVGERLIGDGLL